MNRGLRRRGLEGRNAVKHYDYDASSSSHSPDDSSSSASASLHTWSLLPTSERESLNMNCTILQWHPPTAIPRTVTTSNVTVNANFMIRNSHFPVLQLN
ncbi:hypothetical protein NL676_039560 [Syzygium grande]|nr:hypothetical protein NL676_039560 [Syzygium grande]